MVYIAILQAKGQLRNTFILVPQDAFPEWKYGTYVSFSGNLILFTLDIE
jgi:hypothetical protein